MTFVRDSLRAAAQAIGPNNVIMTTAAGNPSHMIRVPRFNLEDIDPALGTGAHPAFIVGGVEKTEFYIGKYQGFLKDGELLSLPDVDPTTSRNMDQFIADARACGAGWGVATNAMYSALALWCWKNGFMPRGNSNYGRSSDATWETGIRQDGVAPGTASGSARTLTGSGPNSWRHNNAPDGIADLCGNVWEWSPGLRIVGGEIQIIPNNDAALLTTDHGATSAAWRAINAVTGALVVPTFTGTVAGGDYVATTANTVRYALAGTDNYTLVRASGSTFEGMLNPGASAVADAALQVLKAHGMYPVANTGLGGDGVYYAVATERLPVRGGGWSSGSIAGVFALGLDSARSYTSTDFGARPAFVL